MSGQGNRGVVVMRMVVAVIVAVVTGGMAPAVGHADVAAGLPSEAIAINARGQVVGFRTVGDARQAVLWDEGREIALGFLPGGQQSMATDVNDAGW